jgi:hypothetical protein
MKPAIVGCALALGAFALGACNQNPAPDYPLGCIPHPNDGEKLAQATDTTGTDSKIRATEPMTEPLSESPGGTLDQDRIERRYYEDKDERHLENRRTPKQLDSPDCPEVD